ncbi:Flavoprotein involved in K+ transport [Madurella fahalii]|uniref:Flavoprotein involved in K+ transport n=1 Tax=Madurella fahalii TaxID=1157608 RepID=A0ABQ0GN97_9PEZI
MAAANTDNNLPLRGEHPPAVDLRGMMAKLPLPVIPEGTVDPASMAGHEPTKQALAILDKLNAALAANDVELLESCFFASQAYWRDALALTYHLRTFTTPGVIATCLLETKALRRLVGEIKLQGTAQFIPAAPVLQFIDCDLVFKTSSPAATCIGRIVLLPVKTDGIIKWKIWILSTRLGDLDVHPENEALLKAPGRQLDGVQEFETDVFIIGGGNAAVALAARCKAFGIDSVMAERNAQPGDNWQLRYDCMKFHIPTSFCELPYMAYDKELQTPHLLTRDELAEQVRRYVKTFNLNMINSAQIRSTTYDQSAKRWTVKFQTPSGQHTAVSKHLVQATGFGSQKIYIPPMADEGLYKGISIHSAHYKNATELKEKGVKSVLIIGSANTAFDILEDCHAAGLQTTMNARSTTYIVPLDYVCDNRSLAAYDFGVPAADRLFMTLPTWVDSQFAAGLFAQFAAQEPDRYKPLAAAGFPCIDSSHPEAVLMHHLLERAGGHYVDIGGTKLIVEGKVDLKALVEPVGYTETGLRFSDGSTVDADAVVWCTGFCDHNGSSVTAEILGASVSNGVNGETASNVLGPNQIAARVDATWGVDAEGEVRGMWKRQLRLDNFWMMGGYTQQHRWHSRTVALQIKADLEGILPPAYRDTPEPRKKN